jgi:hypothetical protein
MGTRPAADIEKAFEAKGMERDESHHHMFRKKIDGVTTLVSKVSHDGGEIGDSLAKLMANQVCLQLKEFWQLVECTLSEEEWEALVAERCQQGRNPFIFG